MGYKKKCLSPRAPENGNKCKNRTSLRGEKPLRTKMRGWAVGGGRYEGVVSLTLLVECPDSAMPEVDNFGLLRGTSYQLFSHTFLIFILSLSVVISTDRLKW